MSTFQLQLKLQLTLYYLSSFQLQLSSYQLQLLKTTFQSDHFTIVYLCSYFLNHNVQSNFHSAQIEAWTSFNISSNSNIFILIKNNKFN